MLKIVKSMKFLVVAAVIATGFSPNAVASDMQTSFTDLPPEVVYKIFKELPRQDKLSCMKVSKAWGGYARDRTLWKGEQFKSENAPKAPIPEFVRHITIDKCKELTDENIKYFAGHRDYLRFMSCNNVIHASGLGADMIKFMLCGQLTSIKGECRERIDFDRCPELIDIICGAPHILLCACQKFKSLDKLTSERIMLDYMHHISQEYIELLKSRAAETGKTLKITVIQPSDY